jgi:hypothetical protein
MSTVMKKKLEADLISIAHKVLQMKNKSDLNQLFHETQRLYEKLAVLRFVETHFGDTKPTVGQAEVVEKMKEFFEEIQLPNSFPLTIKKENSIEETAEEPLTTEIKTIEEVTVIEDEIIIEKLPEIVVEKPIEVIPEKPSLPVFNLDIEKEVVAKPKEIQISFEDLLGSNYIEPQFVKAERANEIPPKIAFELPKETPLEAAIATPVVKTEPAPKKTETKSVSLNDKFAKGITIGLNDRIAFVKNLFGGSEVDYSRVMNQLITYDSFEEAQSFIDDMVKPDYNNWEGKAEYSQRFMEIIEKKFT